MKPETLDPPEMNVFSANITDLIGAHHTVTSLSRDLGIHRNQLQRFVDGSSVPKPDVLLKLCKFFNVDARILTHRLSDISRTDGPVLPHYVVDAIEPVPQDIFPDGFYEEWRELTNFNQQYVCNLYHVKTRYGMRHTKINIRDFFITSEGVPKELGGIVRFRGVALQQAGGLCIIDRPDHSASLTFTALRFGSHGDPGILVGHKSSVQNVAGSGLNNGSATVLRRLNGGFREAMRLRRQPRYRSAQETPEAIQWLLRER